MRRDDHILLAVVRKWQLLRVAEIFILAIGLVVLSYFITLSEPLALVVFVLALVVLGMLVRPWQFDLVKACEYLDKSLPELEYSSSLLLKPSEGLTAIAKIQRHKIADKIKLHQGQIPFGHHLVRNTGIALLCLLLGFVIRQSRVFADDGVSEEQTPLKEMVNFQPLDSNAQKPVPPKISFQEVEIDYPNYTRRNTSVTKKMNLKVLEGSKVTWRFQFDQPVPKALLQFRGEDVSMDFKNRQYVKSIRIDSSAIYNLKFFDDQNNEYLSELYTLELQKDMAPEIGISNLAQFNTFDYSEKQELRFTATVRDDFGVSDVAIIATVSKGSGESVKFREERLRFDDAISKGAKKMVLQKRLDLKQLKMEAGDELYFYVEAIDYKQPSPNISRTETYFAVIKDTVSNQFAVAGTVGADLMPDYFRSQRQLIIDTKKLIADRDKLKKQDFNFTSNELGFDQKALRLKYGEFMGDESEGAFSSEITPMPNESNSEGNTLASYTHDHDGDNEHNLVEHDHEEGHDDDHGEEHNYATEHDHDHDDEAPDGLEDPLEAYVHNHEDPEASTLFAKSLRSKLKQAMNEMWDAELYLRLFEPEKSLPYQYRALKLIQEIKNSARIYVHRIGFDPPPIKEEKRLSGDLTAITNTTKQDDFEATGTYPFMDQALSRIALILSQGKIGAADRELFEKAGNELAVLALAHPSKYLGTLQNLKWLSQAKRYSKEMLLQAHKGLSEAIPEKPDAPSAEKKYNRTIDEYVFEALKASD